MKFDLSLYDQLPDADQRKTYDLFMSFIVKRVKLDREKKNLAEKEKAWSEIANSSRPSAPASKRKRRKQRKKKRSRRKRRTRRT